jgi:2-isopropylmalate synthase
MNTIEVYDTTLRDGTQGESISLSVDDKLKITLLLDDLGVDYIEGGWPGSNPKDATYFEQVQELRLKHAKIAAFGMTCRVDGSPTDDANIQALLDANTPVVTIVGKTSMLHVTEVLRTTPEENLRMIRESITFLSGKNREVIYDAEHFFDGYKLDAEYTLQTLQAALDGGAELLVLCDTNGGTMPWEVEEFIGVVQTRFPDVRLGIHTHNDSEMANANTVAAVRKGAMHIQGTINGYGERCGNANLCTVIPSLELKLGYQCLPEGHLKKLSYVARTTAEIANMSPNHNAAYVGKSAFAHKGGMHASAIRRNEDSYQHIDPSLVGNELRILVSDLSGRGNMFSKAEEYGLELSPQQAANVVAEIKEMESRGFVFEGAEASVAMLMMRQQADYQPPFELIDFMTLVEHRQGRGLLTEATIKLCVNGEEIHTVSDGNGPVDALDRTLRKALTPVYPQMSKFRLADYKVRILDGTDGTSSTTRVLIDTRNGHHRWSTVGVSANIIEASWLALADSIEYGLTHVLNGQHQEQVVEAKPELVG